MKSHIQVPHFLLKRFSHPISSLNSKQQPVKQDCVYCLHLQDLSITEEDIKELNVQEGYYDKVAEDTLANIESDFGQMVADLNISLTNESKKFYVDKYEPIIQKFALMTLARSKTIAAMVKEKAITGKLFPEFFTPSTMIKVGKRVFEEGFWDSVLPNYKPFLGIMNKNFVLPKCCCYGGKFETILGQEDAVILPVMPQISILIIDKNYREQLIKNNIQYVTFLFNDANFNINIFAYVAETNHDNDFLIAENREDFDVILHYIANH